MEYATAGLILNSRIPYFIGNKIQNHIFKFLSFASLFRVFIPAPDVYSCPSILWHVLTLHFSPLAIPRGAGFAAPLSFPVLLDPALPPSLPEGDSNFKEPQGWHQKNSKQAGNCLPIRFLTWQWQGQQHCPRKAGEETSPGELFTTGLKEKLLHIKVRQREKWLHTKVRQSLLFLKENKILLRGIFSLQVCSAFPSPQLLPGAVLGTICLFVINQL